MQRIITRLVLGLIILCASAIEAQRTTGSTRATQSASDLLKDVLLWRTDGEGGWRATIVLPAPIRARIDSLVPGWRLLSAEGHIDAALSSADRRFTQAVAVADLDGDGVRELLLAAAVGTPVIHESEFGRSAQQHVVILGVRQTRTAFDVTRLLETDASGTMIDSTFHTLSGLSVVRLSPSGRTSTSGRTEWIRWQDGDCQSDGWQWRVRAGAWVKTKSDCVYE